jgi:L-asparaginase II
MSHDVLTVDILRGLDVESRHLVDAVVVDVDGTVVETWGDRDRLIMPRSTAKPIQALPLIETGASAAFELDEAELALACASHNGEKAQVDKVLAWLHRLELSVDHLECGDQPPILEEALIDLIANGGRPGPEHNNCSGKHTGFLTVCRHLDLPTAGYIEPSHPLQTGHITPALSQACRVDLSRQQPSIDGCGIPVWRIPLVNLAAGWARLTRPGAGSKLLAAMMAEPFFVAGTDRSSTVLMTDPLRPIAVKGGAEGVFCGAVIDDGLGITLKVRDGAGRAADVAMTHILTRLGAVTERSYPLTNWAGTEVGSMRVAA